jgi:hypothetical protein
MRQGPHSESQQSVPDAVCEMNGSGRLARVASHTSRRIPITAINTAVATCTP